MYYFAFYTHMVISLITLISGIAALILAFIGFKRNLEYSRASTRLGQIFIVALYFQLLFGIFMYYYPGNGVVLLENNLIDPGNSPTIRLWEIEHAAIMVFALFLVQIGHIFIRRTKSGRKKYILTFLYFGVALLLMLFTMIMAMR